MALERSPELEQIHSDMMRAYQQRDAETLRRSLSNHPAFVMRGTAPDEVTTDRDEAVAFTDESADDFPGVGVTSVEAYADRDLGYVYTDSSFVTSDGAEYPCHTLAIAIRDWRVVRKMHDAQWPLPGWASGRDQTGEAVLGF
jgi:SnoaL-like domain